MKIYGIARLTVDPTVRYSQSGTCVATFSVAAQRRFRREGDPEADFFRVTAFGKLGEFTEKYLRKGSKVFMEGSLRNNNYEKDGVKHYSTEIVAESIEFAESKRDGSAVPSPTTDADGFMNIPDGIDEELPFS